MKIDDLVQLMRDNAQKIAALTRGLSADEAIWKPDANTWSVLEIINHLYDEEKEDFRVRLKIILETPELDWPPIDPAGWVVARHYNARKLEPSLDNFLDERTTSLAWLATMQAANWESVYQAQFGAIRAGDMLTAWVTHDHLHMRQLVELLRSMVLEKTQPFEGQYAGEW